MRSCFVVRLSAGAVKDRAVAATCPRRLAGPRAARLPVRFGREIPTMYVVNEAVTVVVNAIACDLARIHPDVGSKVWMIDVHAGVNHADGDVAAARRDVPSLLGTDVCAGCARSERARRRIAQTGTAEADSDRLPVVLQAPHVGELRL